MFKTLKNFFYITIIIVAAIYATNSTMEKRKVVANNKIIPQEYMHNVKLTHFNLNGTIKDTIHARYWEYLPLEGKSNLTLPKLKVIKPDNSVWTVDAKTGIAKHPKLDSKIEELELKNKVVIERPKALKITPIKLTTEQLFFYPKKDYVQTDGFVKMVKPGLQITGTGLEGYLDKNWVELLHDVKTTYVSSG